MSYQYQVNHNKKINGTTSNSTTSANSYIDPISRALKNNASIFGAVKQLQQSTEPVSSYSSTESSAKSEGKEATNGIQGFKNLIGKLKADGDKIKEKTASVEARTMETCSTITKVGQKVDSLGAKNASIDNQIASLQEGNNSNPFDKPLEAMYSLKTAGELEKTATKTDSLLSTNNQGTEGSSENNQNQQKIEQLNAQKNQNTKTMKTETTKAKNVFDGANQKYRADMNEINGRKQEVAKEIADSQKGQQDGTSIAGVGKSVEGLGTMMMSSGIPWVQAVGAVMKPVGTATNIAGVGLNLAATGALAQAQNKSTEVDKAAAKALKLKQQAAQVYVNALKKSKSSHTA